MLSSLSSTIITVFDIADLPKSTPALFPGIRVRCHVVAGFRNLRLRHQREWILVWWI
jgi:hypothetical protein